MRIPNEQALTSQGHQAPPQRPLDVARRRLAFLAPLVALCAASLTAQAQEPTTEPPQEPAAEPQAPAPEPSLLVRAEKVIVRPGVELENASILIQRGRIVAVGADVTAPEGATVLEGRVVSAGFVDAWASFGLDGESIGDKSASFSTRTTDALDPFTFDEPVARVVLRSGVTAACVQGGRTGRTGGVGALVRLPLDEQLDASLLQDAGCVSMSVSSSEGPYDPFSALDAIDRIARALEDGEKYAIEWTEYRYELEAWEAEIKEAEEKLEKDFKKAKKERDKDVEKAEEDGKEFKEKRYKEDSKPKLPRYDADKEVLARVANGEIPLIIEAHRAAELRELVATLQGFTRVRALIAGGTEAPHVAELLAKSRIPVIVSPTPLGADALEGFDGVDLALAGRLQEAGVRVLFGSGSSNPMASRDLPLLAGLTVGHGLDREAAFAALTLEAARALDVADRIGSVEVGKDADLLILDGDPLASTTRVRYVLSRGAVILDPESLASSDTEDR